MRWTSPKNISPRTADIKPPGAPSLAVSEAGSNNPPVIPAGFPPAPARPKRSKLWRVLGLGLVSVLIAAPLLILVGYFRLKMELGQSIQNISSSADSGGMAFLGELSSITSGKENWWQVMPRILPLFTDLGGSYRALQEMTGGAMSLMSNADFLQREGLNLVLGGQGEQLTEKLTEVRDALDQIYASFGGISDGQMGNFLAWRVEVGEARDFLNVLLPWLRDGQEHQLALFLENSSELRPGGGFLGSYAELTLRQGGVTGLTVRDINESDRLLGLKTVPPKPLQLIVRNWRAADANWFFDFPASAAETLRFLEASDLYRRTTTTFDGAIAISPRVVNDILTLTGPVTLGSGKILDARNFLTSLQAEVQNEQAAGSDSPKNILAEFAPLLLDKLKELPSDKRSALAEMALDWASGKDIRIYFKDPQFQKYLDTYGLSGAVMPLAAGWNGDYLAVVDANVGGDKTDAVMDQSVTWQSQITEDGLLRDHVSVTRKNGAKAADDWWYRTPNQNYLQIFTPLGAKLTHSQGGLGKKIAPKVNYAANGYAADPAVAALEKTETEYLDYPEVKGHQESGKQVFATWTRTAPGETSRVSFDYERHLRVAPQAGQSYEFVFEKQPASRGSYRFEITAPVGFKFRENDAPVFEYESGDPPGRLVLTLTLDKI